MRVEAQLWLKQAKADLKKALNDLRTQDWDSAAFWSQQASEKALKALLLAHGKAARTHNLIEIGFMIKEELGISISEILADLKELTIHYTISRYPNAANALPSDLYDEAKARDLIARAGRVIKWVERNLP